MGKQSNIHLTPRAEHQEEDNTVPGDWKCT
jgi:hypothetical protein